MARQTVGTARLESESDTWALATGLAEHVRRGDVIGLHGDLGAGKTSFARAFIRALTEPGLDVPSPTFTIVQIYEARKAAEIFEIWHVDLYRLEDAEEVGELGLEDAFEDAVVLVEWPDKVPGVLPAKMLEIHFAFCDKPEMRRVAFKGNADWAERLNGMAGLEAS